MKLKIAIVVHGRFHSFDLARELLRRGHDVTLFTNYPRWAVKRFDFPEDRVRSFWIHGVITRAARKLSRGALTRQYEERFHTMFGRWAAKELSKEHWDVVHPCSGVAEEILQTLEGRPTFRVVMRGSAHIAAQAKLLKDEEERTRSPQDRPSSWMISRELREYELSDAVLVLSTFSYNTFVSEGFQTEKLYTVLGGADLCYFRPDCRVVEERCRRIVSGEPLRILYVGNFSFQKGGWDIAAIIRALPRGKYYFRFVGSVSSEASSLAEGLKPFATFIPKQPQSELPRYYAWGDIFILPTIQDGFQTVLGQAAASGLPIITTPNGAGTDIVREGMTGWVLPIRDPNSFIGRLQWCDSHREDLASMIWDIYNNFKPRDWTDVAADFESICLNAIGNVGRMSGK